MCLDDLAKDKTLLQKLEEIRRKEEIYWRQRSRVNWLKKEDANTKFFHAVANGQKNRNFIPRITHEGFNFLDPLDIGRIFTSSFRAQFGCQ